MSEESPLESLRWCDDVGRRSWGNNGSVSEEEKVDESRSFRRDGGVGGSFNGDEICVDDEELLVMWEGGMECLADLLLDNMDLLGFS